MCGLAPPQQGWGGRPLLQDQSDSAHVVRIRIGRTEFTICWDDIGDSLVALGCTQQELDDLKFCQLDTDTVQRLQRTEQDLQKTEKDLQKTEKNLQATEEGLHKKEKDLQITGKELRITQHDLQATQKDLQATQKDLQVTQKDLHTTQQDLQATSDRAACLEDHLDGVCYKLLPPVPSFTGRAEEIQDIHSKLSNLKINGIGVAVTGLGGVGKSELVKRYCQGYITYYENNVLWINSETKISIESSFENIAEIVGLEIKDHDGRLLNVDAVLSKVYRFFGGRKVLFVFDNANDPQLIQKYFNTYYQGNIERPSLIITTQCTTWGQCFKQIKVDVLTMAAATSLVSKILEGKYRITAENNKRLCSMVERLPLALQQATSYIVNNGMNFSEYIEHFKKYAETLLSTNEDDMFYLKTVTTTWKMALQELNESNNILAVDLINMRSYIDGKQISKDIFLEYRGNNVVLLNEAISILQKYSLINVFNIGGTQALEIHSLVRFVIRNEHKNQIYCEMFLEMVFSTTEEENTHHVLFGKHWIHHIEHIISEYRYNDDLLRKLVENQNKVCAVYRNNGKFDKMFHVLSVLVKVYRAITQTRVCLLHRTI